MYASEKQGHTLPTLRTGRAARFKRNVQGPQLREESNVELVQGSGKRGEQCGNGNHELAPHLK